jgi:hypothetical protein
MFDGFLFLYFVIVHSTPYLFHLYTISLPTYIKLVFFSSKIFSRNNLYDKTTFVGSVSMQYKISYLVYCLKQIYSSLTVLLEPLKK